MDILEVEYYTAEEVEQANHEYWTAIQDMIEASGPMFAHFIDYPDELPF